jgi:lipid A 3-O-deacylase
MIVQSIRACRLFVCLFAVFVFAAAPVRAGGPEAIAASAGQFDVFNKGKGVEAGWELRFAPRRFPPMPRFMPDVIPMTGAMATSRGTLYVYGGFRWEVPLGKRWVMSPNWAAGVYYRDRIEEGKDLGGAIEFRSAVELSYVLGERSRLGLCLYHLSNAGLYDFNPGSESLVLTYSVRP